MLDQITLDRMQIAIIPMHDVSPLLTHPDFQAGVTHAQEQFLGEYKPAPLTEDEMINEVEICVGRRLVEENEEVDERMYLYWLGYAYGIINEGLTYATSSLPDLSVLLGHSEFLQGVDDAQKGFLYEYEAAPLDEDQMVALVENNLSRAATRRGHEMFDGTNLEGQLTYLWCLGFVFGIINEGLTYTYTIG